MRSHVDSGGEGHREDVTDREDVADPSDGMQIVRSIEYVEHGSKNCKGLVHQVHLENKMVCHYADTSRGERCNVYLTKLCISKLSDVAKSKDLFYSKPKKKFTKDDPCWFFDTPIGLDVLSRKLTNMFIPAGFDYA